MTGKMKRKLVFVIISLIYCCMTVNATSFSCIFFSIKNLTDKNLILEYESNHEFDSYGWQKAGFYDENNNLIYANYFKFPSSPKQLLIPNKITGIFDYMKDTETEKIPFINRFNQVFKEFKIIDECGNTILQKDNITSDSFHRYDYGSISYILEISEKDCSTLNTDGH